jgi:hypothetical protein
VWVACSNRETIKLAAQLGIRALTFVVLFLLRDGSSPHCLALKGLTKARFPQCRTFVGDAVAAELDDRRRFSGAKLDSAIRPLMRVATQLGQRILTPIPCGSSSADGASEIPTTANLLAVYAPKPVSRRKPAIEAVSIPSHEP